MKTRSRRLALVLVVALVAVGAAADYARADAIGFLAGEELTAGSDSPGTSLTVTSRNCNVGSESTFNFTASGIAVGPYPGTFTESGTVTVEPQSDAFEEFFLQGQATLEATFTIMSPLATITGTKTAVIPGMGSCYAVISRSGVVHEGVAFSGFAAYTATITTSTGTTDVTGTTFVELGERKATPPPELGGSPFVAGSFSETFLTSNPVLPVATPGKATGGGQIGHFASDSDSRVTFGFTAYSRDGEVIRGVCTVVDRTTHIRCLDATSFIQVANTATFEGSALVNGAPTTYRIEVQDNGEPGIGHDTFSISTDSGYVRSGVLTEGDIQVHDDETP